MKGQRLMFSAGVQVELEEFDVPDPGPNQVLMKVTRSQVSAGSEMNGVRSLENQPGVRRPGGYTTAGYVLKVGANVEGFREGDRILAFGNHASHHMVDLSGEPGTAHNWRAFPDRIPEGLTDEQACFAVLGDVALHGVRRATLQIDQSVAVFGAGVVGQLTIQFCRISGAHPIVAIDLFDSRLEMAKLNGATDVVNAGRENSPQGVKNATGGKGAEAVFHCSANPKILQPAMEAAADRAKVILTGSAPGTAEIGLQVELLRHELSILGVYETGIDTPHAYWHYTRSRNRNACFRLIASNQLNVDRLMSHVVPPSKAREMYSMIARGGSDWLSVTFQWD